MDARLIGAAAVVLWTLGTPARAQPAPAGSESPVFEDEGFEAGLARSMAEGKLLLVEVIDSSGRFTDYIDQTRWSSARVKRWVRDNAIAVHVGWSRDRQGPQELGPVYPGFLFVFRDGVVFDRTSVRDPEWLLRWLEGVACGETTLDQAYQAAAMRLPDGGPDLRAYQRLYMAQVGAGRKEEALDTQIWIWERTRPHSPSDGGSTVTPLEQAVNTLGIPARLRLMRQELGVKVGLGTAGDEELTDWLELNEDFGDCDATVEWFDRVKGTDKGRADALRNRGRVDYALHIRQRWFDRGLTCLGPNGMVRNALSNRNPHGMGRLDERSIERSFMKTFVPLYAGLLEAGREQDADRMIVPLLGAYDDADMRRALVRAALEAGQVRRRHLVLLDEADAKGPPDPGLREELSFALERYRE